MKIAWSQQPHELYFFGSVLVSMPYIEYICVHTCTHMHTLSQPIAQSPHLNLIHTVMALTVRNILITQMLRYVGLCIYGMYLRTQVKYVLALFYKQRKSDQRSADLSKISRIHNGRAGIMIQIFQLTFSFGGFFSALNCLCKDIYARACVFSSLFCLFFFIFKFLSYYSLFKYQ